MGEFAKYTSHVLIDWGTSSFRLWCIDIKGALLFEIYEPLGMSKLSPLNYEHLLEEILLQHDIKANVPVLICGMAGAAQGWQEAKYIDLPTKLDGLSAHAIRVKTQGRDVRILPGLAQRNESKPDVMRGEETLLLGALVDGLLYENYCIPGTHSKWVQIENGEVQKFQTFMTGELFALLSEHSTLSYFLDNTDEELHKHEAFRNAVSEIEVSPELLMNSLFSIRSGALLFENEDALSSRARLSGLLIGAELAVIKAKQNGKIGLIAQGELSGHYSAAMNILKMDFDIINSHDLALSGLKFITHKIWTN